MKEVIIKIFLLFQIDKILDKWQGLMGQVRFYRMEKRLGQHIKYVPQGFNIPMVTCARGDGLFSIGKGSHLKSDTYIECMGGVQMLR